MTKILFFMLTTIFAFHFVSITLSFLVEFKVYWFEMKIIGNKIKSLFCGNKDTN